MTNKKSSGHSKELTNISHNKAKLHELVEKLVGLFVEVVWYSAFLGAAAFTGWVTHLMQENCTWMSPWMFSLGYFLESAMFVGGFISMLSAMCEELTGYGLHNFQHWLKSKLSSSAAEVPSQN